MDINLTNVVLSVNSNLPDGAGNVTLTIPSDTNIYNTSSSITANRTVGLNGNNLVFSDGSGAGNVQISTTSGKALTAVSTGNIGIDVTGSTIGLQAAADNTTGTAVSATTGDGIAVSGIASAAGTGGVFESNSGAGISATSGSDTAGLFTASSGKAIGATSAGAGYTATIAATGDGAALQCTATTSVAAVFQSSGGGIVVQATGGDGIIVTADGGGNTITAESELGESFHGSGPAFIETYGVGGARDSNAVFQLASSTQGSYPYPRMSTSDRNTLGGTLSPTNDGIGVYDTTLKSVWIWQSPDWVEQ